MRWLTAELQFKRLRHATDDPADVQNYEPDMHKVPIFDARAGKHISDGDINDILSPSSTGFTLVSHTSAMTDWWDEEELASTYYTEISSLLKKLTGAQHIIPAGYHVLREAPPGLNFVHNDFPANMKPAYEHGLGGLRPDSSEWSAEEQMVLEFVQGQTAVSKSKRRKLEPNKGLIGFEEGYFKGIESHMMGLRAAGINPEILSESRVVLLNTWRQINEQPTNRCPLAVADKRTIAYDGLGGWSPGRMGLVKTDRQRFYYYPDLTPSELLIFVGYDSDSHPHAPCAHSAFENMNARHDAPRKSVELRFIALLPH